MLFVAPCNTRARGVQVESPSGSSGLVNALPVDLNSSLCDVLDKQNFMSDQKTGTNS